MVCENSRRRWQIDAVISLTPTELHALTGYRTATHQARWLAAQGVPHRRNKCGQVVLSRAVAEAYLGGSTPAAPSSIEPDFGSLKLIRGGVRA